MKTASKTSLSPGPGLWKFPSSGVPLVAIVGRPNVGKSTLFNRLIRERRSIVADEPGTTRDRVFASVSWDDRAFNVVDTAGLDLEPQGDLRKHITGQVRVAIEEADLVLFLVDAKEGLTSTDEDIADLLRRSGKAVVLAANKSDSAARISLVPEFYRLGLGEPLPISAYHGLGIDPLISHILELFPESPEQVEEELGLKIAIVGRPNVGKSMLLNAILGQERSVVSETPGTTRDSLDTPFNFQGQRMVLIDTAGIRRRGHISQGIERYSSLRAITSIQNADVAVLVLEAFDPATNQDTHIASFVTEACKGIILAVNKWDLAEQQSLKWEDVLQQVKARFKFVPYASIMRLSAKTGEGVKRMLEEARAIYAIRKVRVPKTQLSKVVGDALALHRPPIRGTRRVNIYQVSQTEEEPPTFVFTTNEPELVHFSYRRYLENTLRESIGFWGTPIRMIFQRGTKR